MEIFAKDIACPHGALNTQFCDKNGDLLADTPTNPSEWLDPYVLVFGSTPNQSFFFKEGAKKSFIKHIEKVTGKKVVFFPYQTNAAELEAMRSGMLHIAGLNTGSVPTAVNCAGFHLFAMTAKKDGSFGYEMEIITYPGSGINTINDIKGETILFVSTSSNSGYKAPVALLKEEFGMQKNESYKSHFSGKHSKSVLKVANKKYRVAAVASGVKSGMIQANKIAKNSIITIYKSQTFPTTGYGYAHNLKPELAKKIERAFVTFKWQKSPNSSLIPFNKFDETRFIPAQYKSKWGIIRTIDKANNISYQCKSF
jgi:phosphonate transport system substrate-binding protein